MAVASWRPALWCSVAFNADPNDPSVIPSWSDLSSPFFIAADNLQRGRQYELDQNQASQPSFSFLDQSEYLNPDNASSPYAPNVLPLRQILFQAMWPNQATGNLMNGNQGASSILGTTSAGYDPSFESYTVGSAVPWITAMGGTTPIIGTTTPHSGSQDLTYTIASASTEQGVSWPVPAVPGQQYTASVYLRQTAAVSQEIAVGGLTTALDAYNRTTVNGWGTADVGGSWTTSGGSSSDYSVLPGVAGIEGTTVNVVRTVTTGTSARGSDTIAYVQVDQVATGAAIRAAVIGRRTASTTFYFACADFNTDGSVTFAIRKLLTGAETTLTSVTMPFPYAIDTEYGLRLTLQGNNLSASMWQQTGSMPAAYTLTTTDSSIASAGVSGCYQKLVTSNTNTNPNTFYSTFSTVATVIGSTTTTTGSYVRLSATFTATASVHTVQVSVMSPGSSGTVLVDDPQYEQGATAGTFTTSGPTIYGVFRGFVERWPSQWTNAGFLGYCSATGVDAFEALNLYTLNSEYYDQVLTLQPTYYWPLNDASGATTFGEQSGNNGPPLTDLASKYGVGTLPLAGAATDIPGDPGGTGATFTPDPTQPTGFTQKATILAAGWQGSNPVSVPPVVTSWAATFACWYQASSADDASLVNTYRPPVSASGGFGFPAGALGLGADSSLAEFSYSSTVGSVVAGEITNIADGLPHLLVGRITQNATTTAIDLYLDGALNQATSAATSTVGLQPAPMTLIQVGGSYTGSLMQGVSLGTLSHIAIWDRQLSVSEVTALWDAGGLGNAGETSGTRIARYVASAWGGLTDIDTGSSIMGISTVTTDTPVLQACQDVTVSEQGNFWADKDGQIVFAGRQDRYLNLTSLWTFGDDVAGGELPYQDDLEYDFDPTFVYGQVTVNNADGVTATVSNLPSQRSYFPRSNTTAADLQSDDDAIQLGYWLLNTHDQPVQRIQSITLDPMGNPDLWQVILSLEIGDRITVIRRPKAANGGAGLTMSGDFFVENIAHNGIDMSVQNTWKTTLLLSPAQETSGVFIFDDPTYGTFNGTFSRFAY